jgi:hypothetical protein
VEQTTIVHSSSIARIVECQRIAALPLVRPALRPGYTGPPPELKSQILSSFPDVFGEFRGNHFALLWRGSSSGFSAEDFHKCCDGHWNTLTIIADIHWNVFGGFVVPPWEPRVWNRKFEEDDNRPKGDSTGESFLFSLRNPCNTPAMKFPLITGNSSLAIRCDLSKGPCFGAVRWGDITVYDKCNLNSTSHTRGFGGTYDNTSERDGRTFFTGSEHFTAREIEVFEITN